MLCDKRGRQTERQRQGRGKKKGKEKEWRLVSSEQHQRTASIWIRWWHGAAITGEGTVWTEVGGEREVQGLTGRTV